ncbi:hypothetical protein COB52_00450 [Candidatus Kaiserbacteria bacterium]|nr:MAG: hypothetical protein COB52_00450 [Candidatus Kaiserbacteria bacterium]
MQINEQIHAKLAETSQFLPPHCPNPKCENYGKPPLKENWCQKIGSFYRKNGDRVPRWLCTQGKKTHSFSYAAFECAYWLKRRDLLPAIAQNLGEQSCLRGLARTLGVSQNCIYGQSMRIGRHCLVLHEIALKSINPKRLSTLIFDEMESWEVSQFVPTTHPMFMDYKSGFKLSLSCSPINRKGRMTTEQRTNYKVWCEKYGKVPRNSSTKAVGNILKHLKPIFEKVNEVQIATDEKRTYASELKRLWGDLNYTHMQFNSKEGRSTSYMGKINAEDQYIRQRCSTMRRETLDCMKRHSNTSLRHATYMIKRNFVMATSHTKRKSNPAVKLGLIEKPVKWVDIFSRRVIDGLSLLPVFLKDVYLQKGRTPFFKNSRTHKASYAI